MSQFPLEKNGPTKNEKRVTNFELFLEFLFSCFKAFATEENLKKKRKKGTKNTLNYFWIFFAEIPLLQKYVEYFWNFIIGDTSAT